MKLKTLEDLEHKSDNATTYIEQYQVILKREAIKLIKNLQGPDSIYSNILDKVPEEIKGEIAKDKWNDTMFRYGSEYGMIAMLIHFFNITEEDLE